MVDLLKMLVFLVSLYCRVFPAQIALYIVPAIELLCYIVAKICLHQELEAKKQALEAKKRVQSLTKVSI